MADTRIEWTRGDDGSMGKTWNPVRGCSRVSEGCRNCYAESVAARFSGPGQPYHGLAQMKDGKPRWTGKVELVEKHLADPVRWKTPRRVFVNSMSDLFHEGLSDVAIGRVFRVMQDAPRHTFQVLTKRPERMRAFQSGPTRYMLPNVWLGVSVEDQATADERIPLLLQTPAAIRFVSFEPLLEAVELNRFNSCYCPRHDFSGGFCIQQCGEQRRIDWGIVGGESGSHARPFDLSWARGLKRDLGSLGSKIFVKQLGANAFDSDRTASGQLETVRTRNRKGGDWSEWPEDLRVREFPA